MIGGIVCFVWIYAEDGAMLCGNIVMRKKTRINLVEWKMLVDTAGIESDDLKDKCLFLSLTAFLTAYKEYLPILLLNEDLFCQL